MEAELAQRVAALSKVGCVSLGAAPGLGVGWCWVREPWSPLFLVSACPSPGRSSGLCPVRFCLRSRAFAAPGVPVFVLPTSIPPVLSDVHCTGSGGLVLTLTAAQGDRVSTSKLETRALAKARAGAPGWPGGGSVRLSVSPLSGEAPRGAERLL